MALTTFDAERGESALVYPFVLPQSRGVLFTTADPGRGASAEGRPIADAITRSNKPTFVGLDQRYLTK
jgi:hypothetical protein